VSIKDILIYFYLPVILFTVLCFCVIIVGIIYWIKKYKELLIILFYFLIHAGMTAMYIYPFNVFAFSLQYAFFLFCLLMFCFSAVFMVLPDASNNSDSSYRAVQCIVGKSILVYVSIVFLTPKEQLIISTVDCMVSLVFISVKPKPATSCVQPFAEKGRFIFYNRDYNCFFVDKYSKNIFISCFNIGYDYPCHCQCCFSMCHSIEGICL